MKLHVVTSATEHRPVACAANGHFARYSALRARWAHRLKAYVPTFRAETN